MLVKPYFFEIFLNMQNHIQKNRYHTIQTKAKVAIAEPQMFQKSYWRTKDKKTAVKTIQRKTAVKQPLFLSAGVSIAQTSAQIQDFNRKGNW